MRHLIICFFSLLSGVSIAQSNFTDLAPELGIEHFYFGGLGGGTSCVDFNEDGWDDISFASGNNDQLGFFLNDKMGGFEKINLNIPVLSEINQLLWIDFDNDGDLDLYVNGFESPNHLYQNQGDLTFIDITIESGLSIEASNSYGANWIDLNRDGWLDLLIGDRSFPLNALENHIRIYLNNSDGTFNEISSTANAQDIGKLPFCIAAIDYNNDRWVDLFYTHDKDHRISLFENKKDSSWVDVSDQSNANIIMDGMGISQSDVNNDGLFDLYITNIENGNVLLVNQYEPTTDSYSFTHEAIERGVAFNELSWGCNFFDVENDGDDDLYVSAATVTTGGQLSAIHINDGQGYFELQEAFDGDTLRSYSNAIGDFNNDGLLDIAVLNTFNDPAQIWFNQNSPQGNWIKISLEGVYSNAEGIGSIVEIFKDGVAQRKYKECAVSFFGQNTRTLHFGIASSEEMDSVKVHWPTGHVDVLYDASANMVHHIREGQTNNEIEVDDDITLLNPRKLNDSYFTDYTDTSQVEHIVRHQNFLGGGVAFFDVDNDGDEDLYLTGGRELDHIYLNDGEGSFSNISDAAGIELTDSLYTTSVIAGDINNDGFTDLFIATNGSTEEMFARNLLYVNNGDLTFTEVWTHESEADKAASMGAVFIDYDQDGLLDIYVINYVDQAAFLYDDQGNINGFDHECFQNRMYKNIDGLSFEEVSSELNLDDVGCALAVTNTDFDSDGDDDILLANDFGPYIEPNALFRNDSTEFSNVAVEWNANQEMFGMGIATGDIDNDLDFDYYITNGASNVLLRKDESDFEEIAELANVQDTWVIIDSLISVSWGANFLDFDNDQDLDLYVANGYVPAPSFIPTTIKNNDVFFVNEGNASYTLATPSESGIDNDFVSRGSASGDFDNDGDIDIVTSVLNVPLNDFGWESKVYKNNSDLSKNWIQLELEGILANRDAIGAQVELYSENYQTIKAISGGDSHCSHSSKILHFGLDSLLTVDSIAIRWPSRSSKQIVYDLAANQRHFILEDTTGTYLPQDTMVSTIETLIDAELSIFPNPTKNLIRIKSSEKISHFILFDLKGMKMRSKKLLRSKEDISYDLQTIKDGFYFLKVFFDNGSSKTEKIIIQSGG